MGYMKDIALLIDETVESINDDLQLESTAFKVIFIQGLIDQLEKERKLLTDNFNKENRR